MYPQSMHSAKLRFGKVLPFQYPYPGKSRGGPPMDLHMSKTEESFNSKLSNFKAVQNRSILHRHINVIMRQDNLREMTCMSRVVRKPAFCI